MNLSTQWLPKIPTGWQIANPKTLFSERTQKSTDSDIHLTPSQKFGVLPQSKYMEITGGSVVLNLTGSDNMKHVEKNDFIIHLRSFQGGIEHSNYSGKVSNAYCVLRPTQRIEPRYFKWVLKSQGYIQELNATTDQLRDGQSIKFEQFASIGLPLPPIEEQRRIATFLDEFTAQINRGLELKSQVNLLNESAYMSQLRRLLSPPDDLDDRELQGWVTKKVAWLFKTGSGTTPTSDNPQYFEGSIPWINSGDLNDSLITESKTCISEEAFASFSALKIYPTDSLLVAMYGATIGKTGILGLKACVNQAVCVLEPIGDLTTEFAHYWFISNRQNLIELSVGGGQPNINQDIIRQQRISFPSIQIQNEICAKIKNLSDERASRYTLINQSLKLLQEYRETLITAAVTGQLESANRKKSA